MVFLHGAPVRWRSAHQSFVTLSTADSELVAGLDAAVALQSAKAMLQDFGAVGLDKTLRVDSPSALAIAAGQGSWRTHHLRVRAHYLREQYESGQIIPVYCPGVEQAADLLTKALAAARISKLAAIWGLPERSAARLAKAEALCDDCPAAARAVAQQDFQLSDEFEDPSLPVSLDADLMLAVSIICMGICSIALWELCKWCLGAIYPHRFPGIGGPHVSSHKARKLQRLRDQTAQAIQAELSTRNAQTQPANCTQHGHGQELRRLRALAISAMCLAQVFRSEVQLRLSNGMACLV